MFGKNFGVNFSLGKDGLKINGEIGSKEVGRYGNNSVPQVVEPIKTEETTPIAAAMFKEKHVKFTCNHTVLPEGLVDLVVGMASTLTLTLEHVNLRDKDAIEKQSHLLPGLIQMVDFIQQFQRFTLDEQMIDQVYEATKTGNVELLYRGVDMMYLHVLPAFIKPLKKVNKAAFIEEENKIDRGLDLNHLWQHTYEEIAFDAPLEKG